MRSLLGTAGLSFALLLMVSARADELYFENFNVDGTGNKAFSSFGWQAYNHTGTDYSASTSNPATIRNDAIGMFASYHVNAGYNVPDDFVFISAAPTIKVEHDESFTVSFKGCQYSAYNTWNWFRVMLRVNDTWYISKRITPTTTAGGYTYTINVIEKVWWGYESDLTDGFSDDGSGRDTPSSDSLANAIYLPAGDITGAGIYMHKNNTASTVSQKLAFDDFRINGTPKKGTLIRFM